MSSNAGLLHCLATHFPGYPAHGWQIRPLTGLTGESVFIEQGDVRLIGRARTAQSADTGVSRRREGRILRRLSGCDYAPAVIGSNRDWLLLRWSPGRPVTPERLNDPGFMPELAGLVSRLHTRPLTGYRLNIKAQAERHRQLMDPARLTPRWLAFHRDFMRLPEPPVLKLAPAHMDIHAGNLLTAPQGLTLIDWEYAADTDIGLSHAALFSASPRNFALIRTFLGYYSGYHDPAAVLAQIQRWRRRATYMMLMWYESRAAQTGSPCYLTHAAPLAAALGLHGRSGHQNRH